MADWKTRAEVQQDVVFFSLTVEENEKNADEVFIWDLDKTYLDTKFETFKGLIKTIMERGFQKKNVPGTSELVMALKKAHFEKKDVDFLPIYFITASPPQMEERIVEKLEFDGFRPYGIFCKDNLQNLRPGRLWRLTKQVGYKLQALMQLRLRLKPDVRQVLWGDDSESDALIYSLYSDICARRLNKSEIKKILKNFNVTGPQMDKIFELQQRMPASDPVEKIYINLAADTDSEYYIKFGRRTLPSFNSFQTALDLFQDHRIGMEQVIQIAQDLLLNYDFTTDELEWSLDDLVRRQILADETIQEIFPALKSHGLIHHLFELSMQAKPVKEIDNGRVYGLEGSFEPWIPENIDYIHDYR